MLRKRFLWAFGQFASFLSALKAYENNALKAYEILQNDYIGVKCRSKKRWSKS